MHTSPLRPFAGSLPYVLLAAIATACGAGDNPSPSPQLNDKAGTEHADRDGGERDLASAGQGNVDDAEPKAPSTAQGNIDGAGEQDAAPADQGNFDEGSDAADDAVPDASKASDADDSAPTADNAAGAEPSASADQDGDGLPDSVETNTRVFVSKTNTGTDPKNWDSDGDGISDGDEVLGTTAGLNLPAMGVNPLRKNILLEYDWFDDSNECAAHSHRPTPATLSMVSATFAAAPVSNPDGSTGITVIHDYGQGGVFSGGNRIVDSDGVLVGGVRDAEFVGYRAQNFASNRQGYFHYTLLPHRYNTNDKSSGQAQLPGGDLIVSLYCLNSDHNVAATIVHELGHNLGLHHGGNVDTNYKPNYNSVMNYLYQFDGVDTDCDPSGNGVIDYSRNRRVTLDENALDEHKGTCGTPAWDWNGNGSIESRVSKDINRDSSLSVLSDYDDWASLGYRLPTSSLGKRDLASNEVVSCDSYPTSY